MKKIFNYLYLCLLDSSVRFNLGVLLGMILNMLYIVFNFVLGILYGNVWFITVGAYYMLIVVLRYMLMENTDDTAEYVPKLVSRLLLLVAIPMTGIIVYTILTDYRAVMPRRIVPILVFYAVFSAIRATLGLFLEKRDGQNRKSMHLIRLSLASVSLFNFQVAYLNYLTINVFIKTGINLTAGAFVTFSVIALAAYLSKI